MPYNPKIHHRRSIRLKGYDYSQSGLYYITLSVKNMVCMFGEIVDHQMILNDAGRMIEKWFHELENKYPDIKCGEFVVMPNHFHCIIENNGNGNPNMKEKTGTTWKMGEEGEEGEHVGSPVRSVVQWFKTMTTNEYIRGVKTMGWKRFDGKLWHINYWEHIIRTQQSFDSISSYILENPKNWNTDRLNNHE